MEHKIKTLTNSTEHSKKFLHEYFIEKNNVLPFKTNLDIEITYSDFFINLNKSFNNIKIIIRENNFNSSIKKIVTGSEIISINNETVLIYLDKSVNTLDNEIKWEEELIINEINFLYLESYENDILKFIELLLKYRKIEKKSSKIKIVIINSSGNYELKMFPIKKPKLNIHNDYERLDEAHNIIIKHLNKQNHKGIVLLFGNPGTGKSNYIRYLLSLINGKNLIYLPPDMAHHISSPNLIPFLIKHPNSVLIIEDGENIIKKRQNGSTQAISNLLNLSDGLLSDILNIQVIVTFNCEINEIDEAFLRKGRLICKHEFTNLSIEKGQKLSDRLGFQTTINKELPLSEIYNQNNKSYIVVNKKIGFKLTNMN